MVVEFSVVPLEGGPHFSDEIAKLVRIIKESGISYKLTAMGTIVEGDWNEVMALIKKCHNAALKNHSRVSTSIRIDDFKGRKDRIEGKIKSVQNKLKKIEKTGK